MRTNLIDDQLFFYFTNTNLHSLLVQIEFDLKKRQYCSYSMLENIEFDIIYRFDLVKRTSY